MQPVPTERIDPRCTRSRSRVLAAAVEVLRDEGLTGLSFEAVAARSGVARTTIYRHFADREALHLAALESVGPEMRMPATGDVLADVGEFCGRLNQTLVASDFGSVILTALDGAERSTRMHEMAQAVAARRRAILIGRLQDEQRAGVLAADADLDQLCSQLVGPLFYRRFISRQPTSPAFVHRLVRGVLTPLLRP